MRSEYDGFEKSLEAIIKAIRDAGYSKGQIDGMYQRIMSKQKDKYPANLPKY